MGLAASQARFLGLTARKSNTEYEGQQVNQQRTALANESASLYSQLTNLSVPTPPDITNYYKTEYSFTYNGDTYTMSSLPVRTDNGYTVSLTHTKEVDGYKTVSGDGLDISGATDITLKGYKELAKHIENTRAEGEPSLDENTAGKVFTSNGNTYYQFADKFYQYTPNKQSVNTTYTGVELSFNESGDYNNIKIPTLTGDTAISVSTTSVADDDAYDLAMNAYKKEYSEYEKTMAQINAKTEVLQQQDKTLELRLNQLDTEQNAISTEMDAVQKVIEKNVESTFKTFA